MIEKILNILDNIPTPIFLCEGHDLKITVANNATLNAWGKDASIIGKPFLEALPEMIHQPFVDLILQVYESGNPYYSGNSRAKLKIEGTYKTFYFKFSFLPLRNPQKEVYGILCLANNVTDLELVKQAKEEGDLTLKNLVKQAPIGICIVNTQSFVVELVNSPFLDIVGKTKQELIYNYIWEAIPEVEVPYSAIMVDVVKTGKSYKETEAEMILLRNGVVEKIFVDFVYEPVTNSDGSINSIMIIAIDITDKVIARKKVEYAEERNRLAVEATEMGTFDVNLLKKTFITSERFLKIFDTEHIQSRDQFIEMIHPEDRPLRYSAFSKAILTGKLLYDTRIIHRDKSIHWVRIQGTIYFENEKPSRILGTVLDVTQVKLLQQQKDDFISVASHELKTPMTSLKASIQLLNRLIKDDYSKERIAEFIDRANVSLNKMQHLVDSLLDVSKITNGKLPLNKTVFKLSDLINTCFNYIGNNKKYSFSLQGALNHEVLADQEKIEQVITNFLNNAVKYAPNSKQIDVSIYLEASFVKVTVRDYGMGIESQKLPFLFERYYRVDKTGEQISGLGLGLYISAEIIERHGGKIGVDSVEGKGSNFWFTLPI